MFENEQRLTDDQKRLRRVETYLYLLCKHLGLDPRTGDRLAGDMAAPATTHQTRGGK